ncbi:TRAP transporter large permease [Chloroflexota bacterium]
MDPVQIGIIGIVVLFILLFAEMHIGFALALVGFVGFAIIGGPGAALGIVGRIPYRSLASYTFSVFPLFMLMGEFASSSGLLKDAYRAINTWIGHLPGGLAMATVGGCGAFGAVCGSSAATSATTARVALPEMLKYNYDPALAAGSIAAGGTLGILIPPSLGFIVYGMLAEQSIGKLFMAGIFPGLLEIVLYWITIYIVCKLNPKMGPRGPKTSWKAKLFSIKDFWGIALIFVVVMGGIWGGIFTPTEAGSIGLLATFLLALSKGQVTRQNITPTFLAALKNTGIVFTLMLGAMLFAYFVTVTRLPAMLADLVGNLDVPPMAVYLVILFCYLILGCFLDVVSLKFITLPIFLPIVSALGFDLIWFGVCVVIMTEIGLITPPIGLNVFLIAGMAPDIPMSKIFRGILPFFISDLFHISLVVAFPQIALFLPSTMMGKK